MNTSPTSPVGLSEYRQWLRAKMAAALDQFPNGVTGHVEAYDDFMKFNAALNVVAEFMEERVKVGVQPQSAITAAAAIQCHHNTGSQL